jgi:hypothetical protein
MSCRRCGTLSRKQLCQCRIYFNQRKSGDLKNRSLTGPIKYVVSVQSSRGACWNLSPGNKSNSRNDHDSLKHNLGLPDGLAHWPHRPWHRAIGYLLDHKMVGHVVDVVGLRSNRKQKFQIHQNMFWFSTFFGLNWSISFGQIWLAHKNCMNGCITPTV